MTVDEIHRTPAGPELDALVAAHVIGTGRLAGGSSPDVFREMPAYSTSMGAAWRAVEALEADGWRIFLSKGNWPNDPAGTWAANFDHDRLNGATDATEAQGRTAPHAICLAALLAVGLKIGE